MLEGLRFKFIGGMLFLETNLIKKKKKKKTGLYDEIFFGKIKVVSFHRVIYHLNMLEGLRFKFIGGCHFLKQI